MHTKPLIAVIKNWCTINNPQSVLDGRIAGTCYKLLQSRTTLVEGREMYTSKVLKVQDFGTFRLVETTNSLYILLGAPTIGA